MIMSQTNLIEIGNTFLPYSHLHIADMTSTNLDIEGINNKYLPARIWSDGRGKRLSP